MVVKPGPRAHTLSPPLHAGRIHKFHHDFKQPFGIASVYAHPVEHVLSNLLPVLAGPAVMRRCAAPAPLMPCPSLHLPSCARSTSIKH